MKRSSIIIIALLSGLIGFAQQPMEYSNVIVIDSVTEEKELMKRLKIWLDEAFVNDEEVIQILDEDQGQIVGKGNIPYKSNIYVGSAGSSGHIDFRMKIEVKKGKYRYEFYNFVHSGTAAVVAANFGLITTESTCPVKIPGSPKSWCQKVWTDIQEQIYSRMEPVVESLIRYMAIPTKMEGENW